DLSSIPLEPGELVVRIGLFADSEGDWKNLKLALHRMEDLSVDVAFFLGDLTRWGSKEELLEGKEILDESPLDIIVIPGDHDLAESVSLGDVTGLKNFTEVFGNNTHIYEKGDYKFLLLDNSANFSTVSEKDYSWFEYNILKVVEGGKVSFVILSQPLYHPVNNRIMGIVEGEVVSNVYQQGQDMLELIRGSKVKAIIAADQHMFSNSVDPTRPDLRHISIGALVSNSDEIRNPQAPRFAVLEVYSNGGYKVKEVVL
ncbi:MAG TPA: metallophosphoesterase, partial [candidate division WWE3 bacterium]|nr:metallophosphoesterase [candidate division WWE3 bacterium]